MNKLIVGALVVVLLLILYLGVSAIKVEVTERDARAFVLDDLENRFPGAEVGIINSSKVGGNWNITAWVTYAGTSKCPNRMHLYYEYPRYNFATREEQITPDCGKVCTEPASCVIAYPEQAIISSHAADAASSVRAFLAANSDASAAAVWADQYSTPAGAKVSNVWVVTWTSASANKTITVAVARAGGTIAGIWN